MCAGMNNILVRIFYVLFLSAILALFVGFGIATFHPSPEMPDFPHSTGLDYDSPAYELVEQRYDMAMDTYQEESDAYDKEVTVIALAAAVAIFAVSLSPLPKRREIAYGLLLGSLYLLMYAMARGIESGDSTVAFLTISAALGVVLYLGHRTFKGQMPGQRVQQPIQDSEPLPTRPV